MYPVFQPAILGFQLTQLAGLGRLQRVKARALLELSAGRLGVLLPEICIALCLPLKDGDKCPQEMLE